MIAPTKMYDSFPTISPDEAADLVCEAIRAKPKQINTKLGTFGEVAYALAPKAVDQILHLAYRVFPESSAAKGDKDGADKAWARRPRSPTHEGRPLVTLAADGLEAAFATEAGMACTSLRHDGEELLGDVRKLVPDRPWTHGIPLLHPWANRLGGFGYSYDGEVVTLAPGSHNLYLEENGLPLHGLRSAVAGWELVSDEPARLVGAARVRGRRRSSRSITGIEAQARLENSRLTITTTLIATGSPPGPGQLRLPPVLPSSYPPARRVGGPPCPSPSA